MTSDPSGVVRLGFTQWIAMRLVFSAAVSFTLCNLTLL